jgi:YVTN family beta-propeller protein
MATPRLFLCFLAMDLSAAPNLRIVRTIPVGKAPVRLVLTPDGPELYVANHAAASISVIDTAAARVTRTIPIGPNPWNMAMLPDGSRLYVALGEKRMKVIETATKTTRSIETGMTARDLVATRDGRYVYIAGSLHGLHRIDTRDDSVHMVHAAPAPDGLAVSMDGKLYVNYRSNGPGGAPGHDAIAKFEAGSGALLDSVSNLANVGSWIAVSPDGRRLWADGLDACWSTRYDHLRCPMVPAGIVNVLEGLTLKWVRSIPFPASYQPDLGVFSPDGRFVVLTGDALLLFDAETQREVAMIPDRSFRGFVFAKDGRTAYSALEKENTVAVLWLER